MSVHRDQMEVRPLGERHRFRFPLQYSGLVVKPRVDQPCDVVRIAGIHKDNHAAHD